MSPGYAPVRRIDLRFGGLSAGAGPLTWAQREIWESLVFGKVRPPGHRTPWNMTKSFDLAGAPPLERCLDALRLLVARHESLRTLFPPGADGVPRQVVVAEGQLPVVAVDAEAADANLGCLERLLAEPEIDLAADLPVRFGFVMVNGRAVRVVIRMSRMAADGWSLRFLGAEIQRLTATGEVATAGVRPAQHLTHAALQASSRGAALNAAAITHWRDTLSNASELRWPDRMGLHSQRTVSVGRLTSSGTSGAARLLAAQHHVSVSTVLLGAFTAVLGQAVGHRAYYLRLQSSNRFGPAQRMAVCRQKQIALMPVDLAAVTVGDLLRDTWRRSLEAYRHARYDPTTLRRLRDIFADGPFLNFNDRRYVNDVAGESPDPGPPPPVMAPAPEAAPEVVSVPNHAPNPRIDFTIGSTDHESVLEVIAQTNFLTAEQVHALLAGFEALLERSAAAAGDLRWRAILGGPAG